MCINVFIQGFFDIFFWLKIKVFMNITKKPIKMFRSKHVDNLGFESTTGCFCKKKTMLKPAMLQFPLRNFDYERFEFKF